jgi:hypothetical protein
VVSLSNPKLMSWTEHENPCGELVESTGIRYFSGIARYARPEQSRGVAPDYDGAHVPGGKPGCPAEGNEAEGIFRSTSPSLAVEPTAENAETAEEKSKLKISASSAHSAVKNAVYGRCIPSAFKLVF